MTWIDDKNDPELQAAWSQLGDPVMEHHGEVWQYMGSQIGAGGWEHIFRHRRHPATNDRVIVNIPATIGWPKITETQP
jgi:hypothetical protein